MAVNAYVKKRRHEIDNKTFHFKKLEREKQTTSKESRRKEILRVEISQIDN